MPELPEVETVRQTLKGLILNQTITSIDVLYEPIVGDAKIFKQHLTGQKIKDIDRYGKYLIFILEKESCIVHLRMEGKFFYTKSSEPYDKHTHVIFHLDGQQDLRYHDTRKFGRMVLSDLKDYRLYPPLDRLGQEPWNAVFEDVYSRIHHSSMPIKTLLLDQSILTGIGNIYANEICFRAGLHPEAKGKNLSKKKVKSLIQIADEVLKEAIAQGGTTIHSFSANGIHGLFQVSLYVHGKENEACSICGTKIEKKMVHGRGTYYCPQCQKRRR